MNPYIEHATTHTQWFVGGFALNSDTLIMTWIIMALMVGLALWLRSRLSPGIPSGPQNVLEAIFDFIHGVVEQNLGSRETKIAPFAITLFVFLLLSNWIGLFWFIPGAKSPTADINTTVGLALMVMILVVAMQISAHGFGGYLKHFGQKPYGLMGMLHAIDLVARPASLSLRIFGNIVAGEILLAIIAALLAAWIAWLPGAVWLGWSFVIVGPVQAFIFTVLTVAYISLATSKEH